MEVQQVEENSLAEKRPSADFVHAVAELLETDAADILAEMGYVPHEDYDSVPDQSVVTNAAR